MDSIFWTFLSKEWSNSRLSNVCLMISLSMPSYKSSGIGINNLVWMIWWNFVNSIARYSLGMVSSKIGSGCPVLRIAIDPSTVVFAATVWLLNYVFINILENLGDRSATKGGSSKPDKTSLLGSPHDETFSTPQTSPHTLIIFGQRHDSRVIAEIFSFETRYSPFGKTCCWAHLHFTSSEFFGK